MQVEACGKVDEARAAGEGVVEDEADEVRVQCPTQPDGPAASVAASVDGWTTMTFDCRQGPRQSVVRTASAPSEPSAACRSVAS